MNVGQQLPKIEKYITQEQIERYAEASGDFNPIHIDEEFAATTPFGGRIAHGMLVLAFLSEMMTQAFQREWLESGRLKVRFKAPVFPGDVVTTFGQIRSIREEEGFSYANCALSCHNQKGGEVISGEAWVTLPQERRR